MLDYPTFIYKYTNLFTGQVYVGSTVNAMGRDSEHRSAVCSYFKESTKTVDTVTGFPSAVHLWSIDAFSDMEIIEICKYSNRFEREQHWINYYHSYSPIYGYNKFSPAPEFKTGKKKTQRQAISLCKFDNYKLLPNTNIYEENGVVPKYLMVMTYFPHTTVRESEKELVERRLRTYLNRHGMSYLRIQLRLASAFVRYVRSNKPRRCNEYGDYVYEVPVDYVTQFNMFKDFSCKDFSEVPLNVHMFYKTNKVMYDKYGKTGCYQIFKMPVFHTDDSYFVFSLNKCMYNYILDNPSHFKFSDYFVEKAPYTKIKILTP